jgi:hypothetical protein
MTLRAGLFKAPSLAIVFPEHLVRQGLIGGRTIGIPRAPTTYSFLSHHFTD